jgi:cobalt transport protein ATP-binding subunit
LPNAIEIENLTFRYKDQTDRNALDNISLDIGEGEFLVILGPSGAGKSTLANCLNGIIPSLIRGKLSGDVTINGINAVKTPVAQMAREIGLVFQDFENQLFSTNVRIEIAFAPENFGVEHDKLDAIIDEMLAVVGLTGFSDREPSTLSGGQKQRLAIGSVLAGKPSIICMDEPTTDLDPIGKLGVFTIAEKLRSENKITLIIIEHETEEALYADRVLVLKDGKIRSIGKPKEILSDMNLFDECGIMPLQIPKYFSNFTQIAREDYPLIPDDALDFFNKSGFILSDDRYEALIKKDVERENNYGDVLINIENLEHTYPNGTTALSGVNLQVRQGEFLAILGHNGSGKTTLVKHINGLLQPTNGTVNVCGKDISRHSILEIGKEVGYVFQNPDHQIFSETVFDEVAFSPRLRGIGDEEVKERVRESLHAVELDGMELADPFTLLKGDRQRVAVASVLSARPRIIILDEPTTGLDYAGQRRMMDLVRQLNENGHTIIIITHTMWVVAEYAHKTAVVNDGKIVLYGKTRDIFSKDSELESHHLRTPHIVNLSYRLGKTLLSVDEMLACTDTEGCRR